MPLFDWTGLDGWTALRAVMFAKSPGDAVAARVAADIFRAAVSADEVAEARLARSRWLERRDAESSFPCGVVPEQEPPSSVPLLNVVPSLQAKPVPVMAVALPHDLAFILEQDTRDVVEVGRIPRTAIRAVDVVATDGTHVPEPMHETFGPEALSFVTLTWTDGADVEERFGFRSVWLAWRAARKLLALKKG
jgi:hypothetical protein